MKKLLFVSLSACLLAVSCSKSDDPTPTPSAEKYMSTSVGSTWNYAFVDNLDNTNNSSYVVTSTNRDSTAAGKSYHVFTNSSGGNEYYNITGSDYFTLQAFSLGTTDTTIVNLYMKDDAVVNASWSQTYNLDLGLTTPVAITLVNKIQEKGISKILGSTTYTNVIHVVTTISIPTVILLGGTVTSDIHYYYAPKYGMIQNDAKLHIIVPGVLDQNNDSQTKLQSATIL